MAIVTSTKHAVNHMIFTGFFEVHRCRFLWSRPRISRGLPLILPTAPCPHHQGVSLGQIEGGGGVPGDLLRLSDRFAFVGNWTDLTALQNTFKHEMHDAAQASI